MKNDSKKILYLVIILLSVLVATLGGYLIYDKLINKDDATGDDELINNDNVTVDDNNGESQQSNTVIDSKVKEDLQNIVANEMYILWEKDSMNDITNQDKLHVALDRYEEDNGTLDNGTSPDTITASDLEDAFKKTSFGNLSLIHEDISFYIPKKVPLQVTGPIYKYADGVYTHNDYGRGVFLVLPTYSKVVNYSQDDNEYTISYQYLFTYTNVNNLDPNVYFTYNDGIRQQNGVKVYEDTNLNNYPNFDIATVLEDYVNNNYDIFKDKLVTHNYVFKYENGRYVLTNYNHS